MMNKQTCRSACALMFLLMAMSGLLRAQQPFEGIIYYTIERDHAYQVQADAELYYVSGMRIKRVPMIQSGERLPLPEEIIDLERNVMIHIDHEQKTWSEGPIKSFWDLDPRDSEAELYPPDPDSPMGWKLSEPEADTIRRMPCTRHSREFVLYGGGVDHIGNIGEKSVTIWTSDRVPGLSQFKDAAHLPEWILFLANGDIPVKVVRFDHPGMGTYSRITYMMEDIDRVGDMDQYFEIPEGYTKLEGEK